MKELSAKYFETKFAKINVKVKKADFLVDKLKLRVLPAVICFAKGVVVDRWVSIVFIYFDKDYSKLAELLVLMSWATQTHFLSLFLNEDLGNLVGTTYYHNIVVSNAECVIHSLKLSPITVLHLY
jgi:hypothetical protein